MDSDSDTGQHRELLQHIAAGEPHALHRLYQLTGDRVYALCVRVLGNSADAEEAVADTYLQVWRQAARHDATRGSVIAWLLMISRSRSIDLLRREQRRHRNRVHPPDEVLADISDEQRPTDDLLDARQQCRRANEALLQLTDIQRHLIGLAFLEDLTHQEIALHLGMPLGTVKSHLRRGLAAMRQALLQDA